MSHMMNKRLPPRTSAIFSSMAANSFIVGFSRSAQERFLVASECSLARLREIKSERGERCRCECREWGGYR
jgi:hypothetical protein